MGGNGWNAGGVSGEEASDHKAASAAGAHEEERDDELAKAQPHHAKPRKDGAAPETRERLVPRWGDRVLRVHKMK